VNLVLVFFQEPFFIDFKASPVWISISGSIAESSFKEKPTID